MNYEFNNIHSLSLTIRATIDDYYSKDLTYTEMKDVIQKILNLKENKLKVYREDDLSVVFKTKLGKRRLKTFEKVINEIDSSS